jgi:hypothetical protein
LHEAAEALRRSYVDAGVGERVLELFAGKYSMNVDIIEPDNQIAPILRAKFGRLSKVIMLHQSTSLDELSLEDRFEIATRLVERSPAEFLDTIGIGTGPQLINLKNRGGATAFHWAAVQWSQSISTGAKYVDFMADLVAAGSSVSEPDAYGYSPLMCMLLGEPDRWDMPEACKDDVTIRIQSWGRFLASVGISLVDYTERENDLLRSLGDENALGIYYRDVFAVLDSIAISDDITLEIYAKTKSFVSIWERTRTPGSFLQVMPWPFKIWWFLWTDDIGDYQDGNDHWRRTKTKTLVSSTPISLTLDSITDAQYNMDKVLFGGSQDDHGPRAAVFRSNQQRMERERDGFPSKRRSASTGPAARPFYRYVTDIVPISTSEDEEDLKLPLSFHKCPFDSRWGLTGEGVDDSLDGWRRCLRGCQGRPDLGPTMGNVFSVFGPGEFNTSHIERPPKLVLVLRS